MNRRAELRRTPLVAKANVPKPRPKPAVPGNVRGALAVRSGGLCEAGLTGCLLVATDPAHRVSRKAGGRRGAAKERADRLSNLLHLCRACHDWSHARPAEAYEMGLALREYQDPAAEPVTTRYDPLPVYLSDDGQIVRFEEHGT